MTHELHVRQGTPVHLSPVSKVPLLSHGTGYKEAFATSCGTPCNPASMPLRGTESTRARDADPLHATEADEDKRNAGAVQLP